ncbi:MAG: hypothetical protein FJ033_01805 [Chloroflexi bacterium]|nr:hypothetical protein [Chloroflexota bacterium]
MDTGQTGLIERLRAQRESILLAPPIADVGQGVATEVAGGPVSAAGVAAAVSDMAALRQYEGRIIKLEADHEALRQRVEQSESNARASVAELRGEVPGLIAGEVGKHMSATVESVTDVVGRVGRLENDFTRERERWLAIVTSFDHRLDHRLRSFRQDVTVMLAGMSVLILAMLMLLLMSR